MGEVNESSPYVVMPEQGNQSKEHQKKRMFKSERKLEDPPIEEVIDDDVVEVLDGEPASGSDGNVKSETSESPEKPQTSTPSSEKPESDVKPADSEQEK